MIYTQQNTVLEVLSKGRNRCATPLCYRRIRLRMKTTGRIIFTRGGHDLGTFEKARSPKELHGMILSYLNGRTKEKHMRKNPSATLSRISEKYYVLKMPDGDEIGSRTKGALERYAKKKGLTVEYSDSRKKELRAVPFDPFGNRCNPRSKTVLGALQVIIYKNAKAYIRNRYPDNSTGLSDALRYEKFMERAIQRFIQKPDNRQMHYAIVTLSPKFGNSVDEFYWEDEVDSGILAKFHAIHDQIDKGMKPNPRLRSKTTSRLRSKNTRRNVSLRTKMKVFLFRKCQGLLDPREKESNEFDMEAAIYWFASDYHEGQDSELYSVLSTSKYKPGRSIKSIDDEAEFVQDFYNILVDEYNKSKR